MTAACPPTATDEAARMLRRSRNVRRAAEHVANTSPAAVADLEGEARKATAAGGEPACTNAPPGWFDTDTDRDWTRAADLCAECPIAVACLTQAKERRETHGLWGGHRWQYGRWVRVPTSSELAAAGAASSLRRQRAAWSLDLNPALLRAHAAFARGLRDDVTVAGEREYQRARAQAKRRRLVEMEESA